MIKLKKLQGNLKSFYKDLYMDQHIPFCIERIEDKALLLLNNDFITYSYFETNHGGKWSYQHLFIENEKKPFFKVISWAPIENLFNYPEKYFIKESQIVVNYRIKI